MITDARPYNVSVRGQIGKNWVYWKHKGKKYRRPYKIPFDPYTIEQYTQRSKLYVASQEWNRFTDEEKEYYKKLNERTQYKQTAYNYYIKKRIKEVEVMVKKVTRGEVTVIDGINVIVIPEVYLEKTFLFYNTYAVGVAGINPRQEGIKCAYLSDSTHISVEVIDSAGIGAIKFCYQIIEYV